MAVGKNVRGGLSMCCTRTSSISADRAPEAHDSRGGSRTSSFATRQGRSSRGELCPEARDAVAVRQATQGDFDHARLLLPCVAQAQLGQLSDAVARGEAFELERGPQPLVAVILVDRAADGPVAARGPAHGEREATPRPAIG